MDEAEFASYAERFAVAADEARLRILYAVTRLAIEDGPVAFTEAMDAAGFEDSGRFNYHLERLRDVYVYEYDGRYLPTTAGRELFGLVATRRLGDETHGEPEARLDERCRRCGERLVVRFEYQLGVYCPDCISPHTSGALFCRPVGPDAVAEADLASLAHELDRAARSEVRHLLEHRCTACDGPTRAAFRDPDRPFVRDGLDVLVHVNCEHCRGVGRNLSVGQYLLSHPTVQDYCAEHGIDLHERPQWGYLWARTDEATVVQSRDPWRVEAHPTVDGCRLVVAFDDDAAVAHVDHLPVDGRFED